MWLGEGIVFFSYYFFLKNQIRHVTSLFFLNIERGTLIWNIYTIKTQPLLLIFEILIHDGGIYNFNFYLNENVLFPKRWLSVPKTKTSNHFLFFWNEVYSSILKLIGLTYTRSRPNNFIDWSKPLGKSNKSKICFIH